MKKKRICSIILALSLLSFSSMTAFAKEITVTVNGNNVAFDKPPIMVKDRTLVPVRAIFEALGAVVLWDETTQIINVATDFGLMTLSIGSPYISYRNEYEDKSIISDVAPRIYKDRTYVPVRVISEAAGYNVEWDESNKIVKITGEMSSMNLPEADNKGYYPNTKTPDFGACFEITPTNSEGTRFTYKGVTGQQLVDYMEKNLASAGFTIDSEDEGMGLFIFIMSNNSTSEHIRMTYSKADKELYITLGE